jgi:ankyrin repeat protein
MTNHSNIINTSSNNSNQTNSQTNSKDNSTFALNALEALPEVNLNGSRVYNLVKSFIGSKNNDSITDYFIENRHRLNSVDSNGNNALHVAIGKNDFNNSIKLIALGIDNFHQNKDGIDSLEYAKLKSFTEIANFIEKLRYEETSESKKISPSASPYPDSARSNERDLRVSATR